MRIYVGFIVILFSFFLLPSFVGASYILPYPSYMPGNKLYKVSKVIEKFEKWWYWGSISHIKYNMKLADKYLVEAKTLFEYKQYLLALEAIRGSDTYVTSVPLFIRQSREEKKDVRELELLYESELRVHKQVIQKLLDELPGQFTWTPEKAEATVLNIHDELSRSLELRSFK